MRTAIILILALAASGCACATTSIDNRMKPGYRPSFCDIISARDSSFYTPPVDVRIERRRY